jgi:hypothetical protein
MKKLIFILAILFYTFHSRAASNKLYQSLNPDTAKTNKQLKKLNLKLADLNTELTEIRTRVPVDSVKLIGAVAQSREAQIKGKKRAEQAVGGDMDDVKLAEKQAKKAAKDTRAAEDAAKQLESDRNKVKDLSKQIIKTQQEIDKLQATAN